MLNVYLRSSSYSSWSLCEHKTFLSYTLGLPEDPGKAATLGNVYHKTMEHIAKCKLLYQSTGEKGGYNVGDEYIGEFIPKDIFDNEEIIYPLCQKSFIYYKGLTPHLKWSDKDLVTVLGWVNKSLTENKGIYDPRKKQIEFVEKFFDFEIDEPWAEYQYQIGDREIKGKLALKGTMDLVTKIDDDHYEVLDYKSGQHRSDFSTGEEKTYTKLQTDPQLLIYYYACRKIFPNIKYFDFSIYFLNAGGMFTLCFDDESLELSKNLIKSRFEEMKENQNPRLLEPTKKGREKGNYKCYNCCSFQKNKQPGTDLSICEFFQLEIQSKGLDKVTEEYCNWDKLLTYGDGGGRKAGE